VLPAALRVLLASSLPTCQQNVNLVELEAINRLQDKRVVKNAHQVHIQAQVAQQHA